MRIFALSRGQSGVARIDSLPPARSRKVSLPMEDSPSIEEQAAMYDRWNLECRAGDYESITPEIRARGERVVQFLRRQRVKDARILEVGCGTGWLAERLVEFGHVAGVDLSPAAIEIARDRGLDAEFRAGDFLELPYETGAFDVVVCVETLFYVPDQQACVEKMARLLRPGGLFASTAINKYVYERSSDIGPPKPGQVRRWLSVGELRTLLGRHFEIDSVQTVEPRGDQGLLRLVNSYKVNALAGRIFSPGAVKRLKERAGLGGGVVIFAHRAGADPSEPG